MKVDMPLNKEVKPSHIMDCFLYVFTQPLHYKKNVSQGQFLSFLNSEFLSRILVALPRLKESSLPYYLPIAKRITDWFVPSYGH